MFVKTIYNKPHSLYYFLDWYYLPKEKILRLFKLTNKEYIKKIIITLLDEYNEKQNYNIDDVYKKEIFKLLLNELKDSAELVKFLFDYMNLKKHQYSSFSSIIFLWLITLENIDKFLEYDWWKWTILQLYYLYWEDEDTTKNRIKEKIYEKHKSIIDENNLLLKQNDIKNKVQLTKEEENIKNDIVSIVNNTRNFEKIYKKKYFSWTIFYLFKNNKYLFEEDEIQFVRTQIDLYFSHSETDPSRKEYKIWYPKDNSFSWPWFIPDLQQWLEIALSEWWDLSKYQERITYLIPYLFDEGFSIISKEFNEKSIKIIDKQLIDWLLDVYLHKKNEWLWYFHPSRIISLFNNNIINIWDLDENQLKKLSQICENMVKSENNRISIRDKKAYIDLLLKYKTFIDSYWISQYYNGIIKNFEWINYYENFLKWNLEENIKNNFSLFCSINYAMIILYHDNQAINRRFSQIKDIKTDCIENYKSWIIHSISPLEREYEWWDREDRFFYSVILETIKYNEYEKNFKDILEHAKSFKENSLVKKYLYTFVAEYYKSVPKECLIDVYSKIDDEEFVILYLWVSSWNNYDKLLYKSKKSNNSEIETLKSIIDIRKNYIKYLEQKILKKDEEIDKIKNQFIVITEWKTDWKHLKKMAMELRKINKWKKDIYTLFLESVKEYSCTMWEDKIVRFAESLADLYPNFKIVCLLDKDWKNNKLDGYKQDHEDIYKNNNGEHKNLRVLMLPKPPDYEKYKDFYDNHNRCIELYYKKSILEKYFIIPRDIKVMSPDYWYNWFFFKYDGKKIFCKRAMHQIDKNVYDNSENQNIFILKDWTDYKLKYSKNDFAEYILSCWWFALSKHDILKFDKIFDLIYNAYKDLMSNS